jgi:hypothetical protein
MRLIDCSHTSINIVEHIMQVISEYSMSSKVFSIAVDNASANACAMTELVAHLVPYVSCSLIAASLMHQHCACHIINLIVKYGLKHIKDQLSILFALHTGCAFVSSPRHGCEVEFHLPYAETSCAI